MKPPVIKVAIIHIDGPLKGKIQEFFEPVITIGRHPECHVAFPRELNTISRHHVELRREGNRFLAVDQSTNGTLVNGKPITELFLKSGDVLTISEKGPKISFLASNLENGAVVDQASAAPPVAAPVSPPLEKVPGRSFNTDPPPAQAPVAPRHQPADKKPQSFPAVADQIQTLQRPFIIQFGAVIKSYNKLPIVLGSASEADFTIAHPSVLAQHARIHCQGQHYHIKDLSGRGLVSINGRTIEDEAPMPPDTCISLSPDGPQFQFLGEGRLAEIEPPAGATPGKAEEVHSEAKKSFWPFGKK